MDREEIPYVTPSALLEGSSDVLPSEPAGLSRRSFLAASAGAVAGLSGFGRHLEGIWPGGSAHRPSRHAAEATVRVEPRSPLERKHYVTRPDLTPPGVAVKASSAFSASGLRSRYIFCAPKPPSAANPGSAGSTLQRFPTGTQGLMILDTTGELVWFKPLLAEDVMPFNFRVQDYQGSPTLTWFEGTVRGGHATDGHYVLADHSYSTIATVVATELPCDLHEFILTPEGTALHTAYEEGVYSHHGLPLVVGHAQEVDVATNELLFDWACYPAVHPRLSYARPFGDYFHINSIDLWPGPERNLLISSRNTSAVYLVGRRTGRVLWRLGGKRSDFSIDPDARFWFQHDARALADGSGLSLFDDASQPCPEQYASGKVIALDGRSGSAELLHRYLHTDHNLDVPSQGNCQLLPGGGHLVGWGYLPFFSIYGPSGDSLGAPLILDGRLPDGVASYRTFLFDWVGRPSQSELSLVVRQSGGRDRFTAWVSWNGATEVAAWRLYAGRSAGSLEAVATVRRRGFETEIDFTRIGARDFLVSALDQQGREIGRSRTVAEHDAPGFAHIDSSRATSRHPTRLPKRPDT